MVHYKNWFDSIQVVVMKEAENGKLEIGRKREGQNVL